MLGALGNLVELIDEDYASLLNCLNCLAAQIILIDQLGCLFVSEPLQGILDFHGLGFLVGG